jgi:hypothetical protein
MKTVIDWGFYRYVLSVLLSSVVCCLLLVAAYRLSKRNSSNLAVTSFIREALIKFRWMLWLLVVTDVFLISNHLLVRGLAVGIWDVNNAHYPYQVLVADHARAGRFLQWDPWSNAGIPVAGDPQFGAFSPVNTILGFITGGTSTGFIVYWMLMWWLGGLGMMMLARHFKAPAWGGAAVATGFLFCGTYITHAEHTSLVAAYSFLPFVIWRLDVALRSGRLLPAIEAGALWGLSALAGYPANTIITGCFAGLWAIGQWLCAESNDESAQENPQVELKKTSRPTLRFVFSALTLVLLVGIIVLAPTYFAYFHEMAGTHNRVGALSREFAVFNDALAPGALSTFFSPYLPILKIFSRTENDKGLWPDTDVSMCSIYSGAVIAALALLALLSRPKIRWRWWVLGIGLLNLAFALGQALPLRGWLYDWFYPSRFFRHPAIFRVYFVFAIAVLAVIATRDLAAVIQQPADRVWRRFLAASILVATFALLVFLHYAALQANERVPVNWRYFSYVHVFVAWLGICVLAVVVWLSPPRFRYWGVPVLLLAMSATDAFLTTTISIGLIADPSPYGVNRWKALDEKHSTSLDLTRQGLLREELALYRDGVYHQDITNDQMITKIPAFYTYSPAANNYHIAIANHPKLKQMALGTDRIWFSKEAAKVAPTGGNFSTFINKVESLNGFPLVIHSSEELLQLTEKDMSVATDQAPQIESLPAAERIPVKLVRYSPNELSFEVQSATDGWLLVTDRWARSWHAEINDKPVEVYGGNFIFRAVQVSTGLNKVRFTYQPYFFPWLVIVSWGTLITVALFSFYRSWRSWRSWRGWPGHQTHC